MKTLLVAALLVCGLTLPASAADSSSDIAKAHVAAIAHGDVAGLANYRSDAFVWWVGGPLDGTYAGAQIPTLWKKFAAPGRDLTSHINSMNTYANPKGATVVADVTYIGAPTGAAPIQLHVVHTLLIREGMIQDEIWQVVPAAS